MDIPGCRVNASLDGSDREARKPGLLHIRNNCVVPAVSGQDSRGNRRNRHASNQVQWTARGESISRPIGRRGGGRTHSAVPLFGKRQAMEGAYGLRVTSPVSGRGRATRSRGPLHRRVRLGIGQQGLEDWILRGWAGSPLQGLCASIVSVAGFGLLRE